VIACPFSTGWLQAFVFELLWRRWELRRAEASGPH
jgi:hypothetical protein